MNDILGLSNGGGLKPMSVSPPDWVEDPRATHFSRLCSCGRATSYDRLDLTAGCDSGKAKRLNPAELVTRRLRRLTLRGSR